MNRELNTDKESGYSEEEDEIRIYFELNNNTIFIPENLQILVYIMENLLLLRE